MPCNRQLYSAASNTIEHAADFWAVSAGGYAEIRVRTNKRASNEQHCHSSLLIRRSDPVFQGNYPAQLELVSMCVKDISRTMLIPLDA